METNRSGVLLLRVWSEPSAPELRARLIQAQDLEEAETSVAAAGVDGICDAVRAWLDQFAARIPLRDGSVTQG
jgi:hypothetical protein